ncbi:glycine zipper 2TM domain-containing protein [Pseudoduganella namucuonensis]|uniref:Glycine zipper 2TM domain-containing protein n=1 Tax=Pseudoduganella namucuonensis TaxID=1035707 RepID=A0A1I7J4T2_9BURK|nr:glycine zipper 2TM domain-containing protein [Pseudoduganella namucuonensis]SFU80141.1 Glycine zipper 2TM domain-containing protein [Pseudoduganella namucuonensis]
MSTNPTTRPGTHPLLLAAAVAVVLFCTLGVAALLGWLPSSTGGGYSAAPALSSTSANGGAAALGAVAPEPASTSRSQTQYVPAPERRVEPVMAQAAPAPVRERERIAPPPAVCKNCGVVESVRETTKRAEGSGLGAGAGAVVGGLLGHQIGGGSGRQIATVAGAVGGAVLGNQVEGNVRATRSYTITVRMDNGATRTFHQSTPPGWRNGDQVRVVKGALRAG